MDLTEPRRLRPERISGTETGHAAVSTALGTPLLKLWRNVSNTEWKSGFGAGDSPSESCRRVDHFLVEAELHDSVWRCCWGVLVFFFFLVFFLFYFNLSGSDWKTSPNLWDSRLSPLSVCFLFLLLPVCIIDNKWIYFFIFCKSCSQLRRIICCNTL